VGLVDAHNVVTGNGLHRSPSTGPRPALFMDDPPSVSPGTGTTASLENAPFYSVWGAVVTLPCAYLSASSTEGQFFSCWVGWVRGWEPGAHDTGGPDWRSPVPLATRTLLEHVLPVGRQGKQGEQSGGRRQL
jgi:hypothetical protein